MSDETDKEFLKALAQDVLDSLSRQRYGTAIRLYQKPSRLYNSHTDGWIVEIGQLRPGKCYLQIWLDRFTLYSDRKVCYCFAYGRLEPVEYLYERARKSLGQKAKRLGDEDLQFPTRLDSLLNRQLQKAEFGLPFIEAYKSSSSYFFSVYEFNSSSRTVVQRRRLAERVADFFGTVTQSLPNIALPNIESDIYPGYENRKTVETHVRRERRSYLATNRKQQDKYQCQICQMRFEDVYGVIGRDFAEAHHIVPLSKIKGVTVTCIEDLITVCSNCHSMLHRLEGEQGDIQKLRNMVRRQQKART